MRARSAAPFAALLLALVAPLSAVAVPVVHSDCGAFPDDTVLIRPVSAPLDCTGWLGPTDDSDHYRLLTEARSRLTVTLDVPPGADFDLCVLSENDDASLCSEQAGDAAERVVQVADAATRWRIYPLRHEGEGAYRLRVTVEPDPAHDDCGSGGDAGSGGGALRLPALPAVCSGQKVRYDDIDEYVVRAEANATVVATLRAMRDGAMLCLVPPGEAYGDCSGRHHVWPPWPHRAVASGAPAGDWRVHVYGGSSDTSSYHLEVRVGDHEDCGLGGDADDWAGGREPLALPLDCRASFPKGLVDHEDVYPFDVAFGETLLVTLVPDDPRMDLRYCLTSMAWTHACFPVQAGGVHAHALPVTEPGRWWLTVQNGYGRGLALGGGGYALRVEARAETAAVEQPPQDDCGSGGDAPAHRGGDAPLLTTPLACAGRLEQGDWRDVYRVHLEEGETFRWSLVGQPRAWWRACLLPPDGWTGECADEVPEEFVAPQSGEWWLHVAAEWGSGSYVLTASRSRDVG